jgi:hypothetical protein
MAATIEGSGSKLDVQAAHTAFEKVIGKARQLRPEEVVGVIADVEVASLFVLNLVARMRKSPLEARIRTLPPKEFDQAHYDGLADLAMAAWYARTQSPVDLAVGNAKIPVALLQKAQDTRERMLRTLGYYFADDEGMRRKLAEIVSGHGYRDLADDLREESKLYRQFKLALQEDKKFYRAEDESEAVALAQQIHDALNPATDKSAAERQDNLARLWTLLLRSYNEVRDAGRWLLRHEDGELEFPSLNTVGRAKPTRKPVKNDKPQQ